MTRPPFALRGNLAIDGRLTRGAAVVRDGLIVDVVLDPREGKLPAEVIDAPIVAPGLIDLQVNGGFGVEVGADSGALRVLAARLPETGVTAYLPTVITAAAEQYPSILATLCADTAGPGARALGFHFEGPFLSPVRAGAHRRDWINEADEPLFNDLLAVDALRLMTLAPERPWSLDRIGKLRDRGILVSLGHTDASYEEFRAGVDAGATMATHLYNAMSPFEHRAPGAVGAALTDERVTIGLIADGVHCHAASLELAFRSKGAERIALVSDMMAAAGMPPGDYELGGRPVRVTDGSARLSDGTLAGSVVTLDRAVRDMAAWTSASAADAIRMASEVPARLLGLADAGRIEPGYRADLVLFDDALAVRTTIIGGDVVYRRAD